MHFADGAARGSFASGFFHLVLVFEGKLGWFGFCKWLLFWRGRESTVESQENLPCGELACFVFCFAIEGDGVMISWV